ncbi:MAG: hypothetical protein K8U03_08380 [Planctomycetia bacterium]|nr:hypothetical protein [Planctomycetia bacterium]
MPVYLFTFHAYCSWMPDRRRGFVRREKGILPANEYLADRYRERAQADEIKFDAQFGWAMIDETAAFCEQSQWRLYEAVVVASHVHVLVSWKSEERADEVAMRIKQRQGRAMSLANNREGPWFSRGKSRKRVRDRQHFEHLMRKYLPQHGNVRYTLRNT